MKITRNPSNRTRVPVDAGVSFLHLNTHAVWPIWQTDHIRMWCSECGRWIDTAAKPTSPLPLFEKKGD